MLIIKKKEGEERMLVFCLPGCSDGQISCNYLIITVDNTISDKSGFNTFLTPRP